MNTIKFIKKISNKTILFYSINTTKSSNIININNKMNKRKSNKSDNDFDKTIEGNHELLILSQNDEKKKKSKTNVSKENIIKENKTEPVSHNIYRDIITPVSLDSENRFIKIMSWNIAGLRAQKREEALNELVDKYLPDVIILQETKIQNEHVEKFKYNTLLSDKGYKSFWLCSEIKLGYSGVACLVKNTCFETFPLTSSEVEIPKIKTKQKSLDAMWEKSIKEPAKVAESTLNKLKSTEIVKVNDNIKVTYDMPDENSDSIYGTHKEHSKEGRTITIEFDKFYLVSCYVPNSGEKLQRLDYRVDEWDPFIRQYLKRLEKTKPVIFAGDLNVGHLDIDIHNPKAPHIKKQSGLTERERNSFSELLATGFKDTLRYFYPNALGQFTYWSQRANGRPVNKGIRLDYFICSNIMIPLVANDKYSIDVENNINKDVLSANRVNTVDVNYISDHPILYDSYIIHNETEGISDHCPIMCVLKV